MYVSKELDHLNLVEPVKKFYKNHFYYEFTIALKNGGNSYRCRLTMFQCGRHPQMHVIAPNLNQLAKDKSLPHIYPKNSFQGVFLCLWYAKTNDYVQGMPLAETYIPWTIEWLQYFEEWLYSGKWDGGGFHKGDFEDWRR